MSAPAAAVAVAVAAEGGAGAAIDTPDLPDDVAAHRTEAAYVLVDIGAVLMAVPVQQVVQGIAWPTRLDLLPRRGGAACGVFDYLGQAVAVLDLAAWVDLGAPPASGETEAAAAAASTSAAAARRRYPRALIVRGGGQLVAIGVDAVRGLQRFGASAITRISHDDDAEQLFHSVARGPALDKLASLLDVPRLLALARTWSEPAADGGAGATGDATEAGGAPLGVVQHNAALACGVVACRGGHLAFAVADLVEVLPAPPLDGFASAHTAGLCLWRGRHVPVTSIARCFPALAPATPASSAPLLAIFEKDGLALGLLLDEVPQIRRLQVDAAACNGVSVIADTAADGKGGDATGLLHVLDMAALYARFPERLLSRASSEGSTGSAGGASDPRGAVVTNASSHIVFDADGVASTPIDGIEAVLPLPPLAPGATHMAWRGRAIALRELRAQVSADGTVIVVQGTTAPVGFIVDALQALVQPHAGRVSRLAMAGRGTLELLTIGAGGGQATYSTRDLAQLARAQT